LYLVLLLQFRFIDKLFHLVELEEGWVGVKVKAVKLTVNLEFATTQL